jgi:hypothetical protein
MRRVRYVRCRAASMAALLRLATPPRIAGPATGSEPRPAARPHPAAISRERDHRSDDQGFYA